MSACTINYTESDRHEAGSSNLVAETLFNYLHDVIYDPARASLNVEELPESFRDFGYGLRYFSECVMETKKLASALARGDLNMDVPSSGNEIASPLKSLHASLKHLTWQTQQVAEGDYQQRVKFMGDFAIAFNSMAQQLEERNKYAIRERSRLSQYISLFLSNTPNVLLVFDAEGKSVLASRVYEQHSGLSSEEIQGRTFRELFSTVASEEFLKHMDTVIRDITNGGPVVNIEQDLDLSLDGKPRTYIINVSPMTGENGCFIGIFVDFNDMTEIIQAKHDAEHARELAEHSAKAKSDFLARMSHEIRTPMNAIIGMSSIGENSADPERKDYSFKKIGAASTHLLGIINDILDMSKIEANKIELLFEEMNVKSMFSNIKSIINCQVSDKYQTLILDIDPDIPEFIISDNQRLAQVLTNLLSNAVKFTPEYGSITLKAMKTADYGGRCTIQFSVIDTGIGIPKEKQRQLFIPFEQVDGSISRKYGGTGLGLAISKSIIEMMSGRIWVESEQGMGASFTAEITCDKGDGSSSRKRNEINSFKEVFSKNRILIAEDVDINREIISSLLEETGIEINFAPDGGETVRMFTENPELYDLILMDIQMPVMDGYEATRQIRSSGLERSESIPIIAMTANVFKEDIERCRAAGMDDHLGKPVDINEVIVKLSEYLL